MRKWQFSVLIFHFIKLGWCGRVSETALVAKSIIFMSGMATSAAWSGTLSDPSPAADFAGLLPLDFHSGLH